MGWNHPPEFIRIVGARLRLFKFWIWIWGPKNKKYVSFAFGMLECLGGETNPKVHKNSWCPPPIALNFEYILLARKIRNTCFLYRPVFIFMGWNHPPPPPTFIRGTKLCWVKLDINLICVITCCMDDDLVASHRYSGLTMRGGFTPWTCKWAKIERHAFHIFRPSKTYPKTEAIGDEHLKIL